MFKTKNMDKWIGYEFEPVECRTGKDFSAFSKNLKAEIIAQIKELGCELVSYYKGYFYVYGFIRNNMTEKYVYFSVDVRFNPAWHKKVLVREAKNIKDYTGGVNQWTSLDNFGLTVGRILCRVDQLKFVA